MDKGYLCGALQQGFAQDAAHVGGGLVDAAAADAYLVYHFGGVVHKQYPEFFCGKVAEQGMEQLVDVGGRADGGTSGAFLQLAAFAQFQGCHDGDALAGPMPLNREKSRTSHLPRRLRSLPQAASMRCISVTAVSSVLPEPMRIASSSASLKASAPFCIIFSRGRSSAAHC